jgi:hypothetical protein
MGRGFVLLIALLPLVTAAAADWQPGDEHKCPAAGLYGNPYGFSVEISRGLKGCPNSPVGMSDHGVAFRLPPPSRGVVEAYGGYNAALYQDASEAADSMVDYLKTQHKEVKLRSRVEVHLDNLDAVRQIVDYVHDGVAMVMDQTQATRKGDRGIGYDYAVSLTTTAAAYSEDKKVLETVLKSWKAHAPAI